jgi:hypothetical protein
MTKPKRVILLLTQILMIAAGGVGALIFFVTTTVVCRHISLADIPKADAIHSMTNVNELRIIAEDSSDKYRGLVEALLTLRWYFLGLGAFLALASIVHFCLTPWKLKEKHDDVACFAGSSHKQ